MKKIIILIFVFVMQAAIAETAAQSVQRKLNAIRSMSAGFSQIIRAKNRTVSQSTGNMALQRPGKFRWDTKTPMEQLVVADSRQIWVYDVDLEQVTVKKQSKGIGGTPGLFLGGYTNTVTRDFIVSETHKGQRVQYDLRSKSARDNFQRIKLDFNGEVLDVIELFDQLGQHTTVQLSHPQINPQLSVNLFFFKPPNGVDVVEQ